MTLYTLISAATGDRMPKGAVEISDPNSPISWGSLPERAKYWAEQLGYGEPDELLYVMPGELVLSARWQTLMIDTAEPNTAARLVCSGCGRAEGHPEGCNLGGYVPRDQF